jgi:hypothetical protein
MREDGTRFEASVVVFEERDTRRKAMAWAVQPPRRDEATLQSGDVVAF